MTGPFFTVRRNRLRWLVERHYLAADNEFEVETIARYWRETSADLLCTALNMLARHEAWRALFPRGR